MDTAGQRMTGWLTATDGWPEVVISAVVLISALLSSWVQGEAPDWEIMVAGALLVVAVRLAVTSRVRSTGVVACVTVGLFAGGVELAAFVAILGFFVIEVQLLNARWVEGVVTGGISLVWFIVGSPMAAWSVTGSAELILCFLGIVVAAAVAASRRLLTVAQQREELAVELEKTKTRMMVARRLHDEVADSMTRIVLLAGPGGESSGALSRIHREAREGIGALRTVIRELRAQPASGDDGSAADLETEISRSVADLRALGVDVHLEAAPSDGTGVAPPVSQAVREVFTNVMKYGGGPVRVMSETAEGWGRLYLVNAVLEKPREEIGGTGVGLASVRTRLAACGGHIEVREKDAKMRVMMEFPVVPAGAERP